MRSAAVVMFACKNFRFAVHCVGSVKKSENITTDSLFSIIQRTCTNQYRLNEIQYKRHSKSIERGVDRQNLVVSDTKRFFFIFNFLNEC